MVEQLQKVKVFYFSVEWKWCKYKTLLQTLEGTISLKRQKMNITNFFYLKFLLLPNFYSRTKKCSMTNFEIYISTMY